MTLPRESTLLPTEYEAGNRNENKTNESLMESVSYRADSTQMLDQTLFYRTVKHDITAVISDNFVIRCIWLRCFKVCVIPGEAGRYRCSCHCNGVAVQFVTFLASGSWDAKVFIVTLAACNPFKDEAQTALFKDPVRTAL